MQGDGIVVANIDTVQGSPRARSGLQMRFPRILLGRPANICGAPPAITTGTVPYHGTMVGDDDATLTYQVGMAPNAKWIACKGCETNSCSDTSLNACADWILAPGEARPTARIL